MTKLDSAKIGYVLFLIIAAAAIPAVAQTVTTLVNFDGFNGAYPYSSLVQGPDGRLYGTTSQGGVDGVHGFGSVFKMSRGGDLTSLYSFCTQRNCSDGAIPYAGLVLSTDGSFYGTTFDTTFAGTV